MDEFFDAYLKEAQKGFEGWDFSYKSNTGRMQGSKLSWDYETISKENIKKSKALLDMGTGGGEFLASLGNLPPVTHATEGYEPNVQIAKNRLELLGIKVSQVFDDNKLPFEDNSFDLIINRHESYSPSEVYRILKNGGTFITQQVAGENDQELNKMLAAPLGEYSYWNLDYALKELDSYHFKIEDKKEERVITSFKDVGAIIYYLKAVPWQVPGFSVEKYYDQLRDIHQILMNNGQVDSTCQRFLITVRKS